jgi:hypothetical protein
MEQKDLGMMDLGGKGDEGKVMAPTGGKHFNPQLGNLQ